MFERLDKGVLAQRPTNDFMRFTSKPEAAAMLKQGVKQLAAESRGRTYRKPGIQDMNREDSKDESIKPIKDSENESIPTFKVQKVKFGKSPRIGPKVAPVKDRELSEVA